MTLGRVKVRWPGVLSFLLTLFGILADPHITGLLPEAWSHTLTFVGVIGLALTKRALELMPDAGIQSGEQRPTSNGGPPASQGL